MNLNMNPQEKAVQLHEMATSCLEKNELEKALTLYQDCFQIMEQIDDEPGKAFVLHQMASIHLQRGEVDESLSMYKDSLQITEKIGDLKGLAITSGILAKLLVVEKEDYTAAWPLIKKAVSIFAHLKLPELEKTQADAMYILTGKIKQSLDEKQFTTFEEMLKNGKDALSWAKEQGVEI